MAEGVYFQAPEDAPGPPKTHVLVVGVSDYTHLDPAGPTYPGSSRTYGLRKLSSPALSALAFAKWIVENRATIPGGLASVRLLIAPSPAELQSPDWPSVWPSAYVAQAPTLQGFTDAVYEWKKALSHDNAKRGVFYYAGHGIQKTKDNIALLLSDFGAPGVPVLKSAVELANIVQGLAPDPEVPEIAQEQFYFVDACRVRPEIVGRFSALQTTALFDIESSYDLRSTPILFATANEAEAEARAGGVSYFCEALLGAFETATEGAVQIEGQVVYPVTSEILREIVLRRLEEMSAAQTPMLGGVVSSAVFRYITQRPNVDIVLSLAPNEAVQGATISMLLDGFAPHTFSPNQPDHPYRRRIPMGIYEVAVDWPPAAWPPELRSITHRARHVELRLG